MDLNAWTEPRIDLVRMRRLGIGYLAGAACLAGLFTFFALTAQGGGPEDEEAPLDVELASLPEEEAEPEPEPEPEPAPQPEAHSRPGPRALAVPTEIPEDQPKEADPGTGSGAGDPYQDAKGYGDGSSGPPRALAPSPKKITPPPRPRVADKPVRLTKDMTPPQALAQSAPGYPGDAKAQGIEGTVVVVYVVTESGQVSGVRAVRGPDELRAACEAAVRNWRFKPALLDGRPVSVKRTARFPFRIRT